MISCTGKNEMTSMSAGFVHAGDFPANNKNKPGYWVEFVEEFNGSELSRDKWVPYYLPQWSSKEKSRPTYFLTDSSLVLTITQDQKPWCPEFNGEVKCSSIQTGLFSGKAGTPFGQHRFNALCAVREEQERIRNYTPQYGYFEMRARVASTEPNIVAAFWMIGFEDTPEKSGEICIMEVKGKNVKAQSCLIGYGIHPFYDKALKDEFYEDEVDIDVTKFHIYAAEWTLQGVDFYIDNRKIRTLSQSPNYPMQFMLNIYELPAEHTVENNIYPKQFEVDYIRAYKPINGY